MTTNRTDLRQQLAEIAARERQRDQLMHDLHTAGQELEKHVDNHQHTTAAIQAELQSATDPAARAELHEQLAEENEKLQSAADRLNPKIAQLQAATMAAIHNVGNRPAVERALTATSCEADRLSAQLISLRLRRATDAESASRRAITKVADPWQRTILEADHAFCAAEAVRLQAEADAAREKCYI